ncbi:MAG: hypothetical protein JWP80_3588 [Pseudomonas sp.]|nr:hypothetical protein [Pseudomonas sp.]
MKTVDDFRHQSYKLLLELDAATTGMMLLVTSRHVSGPEWDEATRRHEAACEVWGTFLKDPAQAQPPAGDRDAKGDALF